jgi:sugar lactone lactonase YvrE
VSSQETNPSSIFFSTDGTKMFVLGLTTTTVYQYTLSTGFDISTASYSSNSFSVSSQDANTTGLTFNSDGTKMYVAGNTNDSVYEYTTQLITTSKLLLNG